MHHGGDPGLDHLNGAVQRVQVGVNVAISPAGKGPYLQRLVVDAQLKGREPDMMMGVNKAGDHQEVGGANLFIRGIFRL